MMIGFKVTKNDQTFSASLQEGVTSIIVSRIHQDTRNAICISLGGYDTKNETYPYWYEEKLFLGDKINIKVDEILENSPTISRNSDTENHCHHHPKNIGIILNFKNEKLYATTQNGSIHLIITILNQENSSEMNFDFLATETSPKEIKYWYQNSFQLHDEFSIEIAEIEKTTLPLHQK